MAHGELEVTTSAPDVDAHEEESTLVTISKRERLSNLSFAQRRHELAWRLAQHAKGIQHVAALTAANACTNLSQAVAVSSTALQRARTAWVQADEAQDALYFFHGQLFAARAAPQDVYGAADVHLQGRWYDLPNDMRLAVDAYQSAPESRWSRQEVDERWQMAVRNKLARGEVGWMKLQQLPEPLWKLSLCGGILKLFHGQPKQVPGQDEPIYPISALLTVFSTANTPTFGDANEQTQQYSPGWTLLSLDIRVQAITGEFNHQLEASNRQRFDLHRLTALAMNKEESKQHRNKTPEKEPTASSETTPARPLHALFQVAHTFALSWQLELLSAQAQALRRGVWGAGETDPIHVTPVKFLDGNDLLGVVSISFWKVDDAYGYPSMGDLNMQPNKNGNHDDTGRKHYASTTSQLTLSIRAQVNVGIRVSLSGARELGETLHTQAHVRSITEEIIEATSNPLALSVSNALLAATRLCADRKCIAVVEILERSKALPEWIRLVADRGSIDVTARIQYHGVSAERDNVASMPILFRLLCDTRTGGYVVNFPRQAKLLRQLACNSNDASEPMSIRIAALPPNRRRSSAAISSGRAVRNMFEGLLRSVNVLGQRVGVGGTWDDTDDKSAMLRERAILTAGIDVKESLIKCCGVAALYGLTPVAVATGLGLDAVPDMAGEAVASIRDISTILPAPPVSVLRDQQLVEVETQTTDGVAKKSAHIQQTLFSLVVSATEENLTLVPLAVTMQLHSPSTSPIRVSASLSQFQALQQLEGDRSCEVPPLKRLKRSDANGGFNQGDDLMTEVAKYAAILSATLEVEFEHL